MAGRVEATPGAGLGVARGTDDCETGWAGRSDVDDLLRRGPGLMMCHFAGREGAREGGREGTTCQINHVILCVMPLHFSLVVVVV